MTAYFNRFTIKMTLAQALSASHSGSCDADVRELSNHLSRPRACTKEALKKELEEYGAWEENELENDAENWQRILWIAAGNIKEENHENKNK